MEDNTYKSTLLQCSKDITVESDINIPEIHEEEEKSICEFCACEELVEVEPGEIIMTKDNDEVEIREKIRSDITSATAILQKIHTKLQKLEPLWTPWSYYTGKIELVQDNLKSLGDMLLQEIKYARNEKTEKPLHFEEMLNEIDIETPDEEIIMSIVKQLNPGESYPIEHDGILWNISRPSQ